MSQIGIFLYLKTGRHIYAKNFQFCFRTKCLVGITFNSLIYSNKSILTIKSISTGHRLVFGAINDQ